MTSTRPIPNEFARLQRYKIQALSGSAKGTAFVPDDDGVLRVGRAPLGQSPLTAAGWMLLDDPSVSQLHFEASAGSTGVVVRDTSLNGTWLGDACVRGHPFEVTATTDLRVGEVDLRLLLETHTANAVAPNRTSFGNLTGKSPAIQRVFDRASRFAPNDLPVLITGESGTGKTQLARAIHDHSRRSKKPFGVIDCAALAEGLLQSELFGHQRGSFPSAHSDRAGLFEAASGGTVFLDEIGELPSELQGNLLRVIEEKKVRRVGENVYRDVDVRIIGATNRDLAGMVGRDRFRLDLYMRLAVCTMEMPPLRNCPEDLLPIANALLAQIREKGEIDVPRDFKLSEAVRSDLGRREWHGNVRELNNYLRTLLATGEIPPPVLRRSSRPPAGPPALAVNDLLDQPYAEAHDALLLRFDRTYLPHNLKRANGHHGQAAKRMGMHRGTLTRRLEECGLRRGLEPDDDGSE